MTWFQILQSRSLRVTRREIGERRPSRCLDERDDLSTTDRLKGERGSYLKYFHDGSNPKFNYYLRPRHGKPGRSALYLAAFAH